jgi:hypothetical protein
MRKNLVLKRGLAVMTVLALLCVFTVSAFAAATYETTTTYDLSDPSYVNVTSIIYDVEQDDQITYLAYDREDEDDQPYAEDGDTNIIYIDQKQPEDGEDFVKFEYRADINKISNVLVKFGSAETEIQEPKSEVIHAYEADIDWNEECGDVEFPDKILYNTPTTFKIMPNSNYKIGSITVNGDSVNLSTVIPQEDGSCFYTVDNVDEDFSMTVGFIEDIDDYTPAIKPGSKYGSVFDADNTENNSITTFSTVKLPKPTNNAVYDEYDFGILFSKTAKTVETLKFPDGDLSEWDGDIEDLENDVTKYRAKAIGYDGKYAVRLIDGGSDEIAGADAYYTRPYLVVDGEVLYGAIQTFSAADAD